MVANSNGASRIIAAQFGHLILRRDYRAAWLLLTGEGRAANPPEAIQAAVEAMISYAPGPILEAQVIESATVDDWPSKRPGDVSVVYVALSGDGFSEAATLTLVREAQDIRIRAIVWGRP